MLIAWNQYCNILLLAHCLLWKIKHIFLITKFLKLFSEILILNCMIVLFYKFWTVSHIIPFYFCMNYFAWFNVCIFIKYFIFMLKNNPQIYLFLYTFKSKKIFKIYSLRKYLSIDSFFIYHVIINNKGEFVEANHCN